MSIAYSAGWVDDGDAERGTLWVNEHTVPRVAGAVYDSPLVRYRERAGREHDYVAEAHGIRTLCAKGVADVELHGYTHMHPNYAEWATSPDRYHNIDWYREFGDQALGILSALEPPDHPLAQGVATLRRYFDVRATTFVPPGDAWTNEALETALKLGLMFVDSYYLAIRDRDRFCWTTHICAPYLDEPEQAWFDSKLPVIGYFHDRDIALYGVHWFRSCLERWQQAGARRILDFRELAGALSHQFELSAHHERLELKLSSQGPPLALVRPVPILIWVPDGRMPTHLSVASNYQAVQLCALGAGFGRAEVAEDSTS